MTPTYIIRARADGQGVDLTGPRIPYSLWYLDEMSALGYAEHIARDTGGRVWVLDARGFPIVAETLAKTCEVETAYGPQVEPWRARAEPLARGTHRTTRALSASAATGAA